MWLCRKYVTSFVTHSRIWTAQGSSPQGGLFWSRNFCKPKVLPLMIRWVARAFWYHQRIKWSLHINIFCWFHHTFWELVQLAQIEQLGECVWSFYEKPVFLKLRDHLCGLNMSANTCFKVPYLLSGNLDQMLGGACSEAEDTARVYKGNGGFALKVQLPIASCIQCQDDRHYTRLLTVPSDLVVWVHPSSECSSEVFCACAFSPGCARCSIIARKFDELSLW